MWLNWAVHYMVVVKRVVGGPTFYLPYTMLINCQLHFALLGQ